MLVLRSYVPHLFWSLTVDYATGVFSVKNSGGTEEPLCCGVIAPSVI